MFRIIILSLLIAVSFNAVYGETISTTLRHDAKDTIFDGKWTFTQEWKSTSENIVKFDDDHKLVVRTGHDYENLYVLIDFISDRSIQKFSDRGIVCIDSKMDAGNKPDSDDYCFTVVVGSDRAMIFQGGYILAQNGFLKKIENHPNLIAVGGVSDRHDRYSDIPHTSYEFKIPLEIFGKSDVYGFYVGAFDAKTGKEYSWPSNIRDPYSLVLTPDQWGQIVSPDKSIPEFNSPILILLSIIIAIFLGRTKIIRQRYY